MSRTPRLDPLIEAARRRAGLPAVSAGGWMPASAGLRDALSALDGGDHAAAIDAVATVGPDADGRELGVVGDVIRMSFETQREHLDAQIEHESKIRHTAAGEITVLDLRLDRRRFRPKQRLTWITVASALLIVPLTLLSMARFGMHPGIGVTALAAFATGAALLLVTDRRNQRHRFDEDQAMIRAEVAEEKQILHAEIRQRELRLRELAAERSRLVALMDRLDAVFARRASPSSPPVDPAAS